MTSNGEFQVVDILFPAIYICVCVCDNLNWNLDVAVCECSLLIVFLWVLGEEKMHRDF